MNRKGLAILLRTKMRPLSPAINSTNQIQFPARETRDRNQESSRDRWSIDMIREFDQVKVSMHSAISMDEKENVDAALNDFSAGYFRLSRDKHKILLHLLAKQYDVYRIQVRELMKQYLDIQLPSGLGEIAEDGSYTEEAPLNSFYRIERNLKDALKPMYEVLFERLNTHPGGLKFLTIIRADILSILAEENIPSLRALESNLREKLITWLSPANLELHQITWDDSASLLEKIVHYEAVHPISNLLDLKRRLGVGRRCFGYLHPTIPGEPLIFIEVALMKNVAQTIQEVLWDEPPIPEPEATCALFYSISSSQPGLAGINLGKFLIKRVIDVVRKDMPNISTFATLSPIPGFLQWLLPKLASADTFQENMLDPEEETALLDLSMEFTAGKSGMEIMLTLLTLNNYEWTKSDDLITALRAPMLRLCARYLLQEKKRGKALDSVANFHLQNGATVGRVNWMADRSEKGLSQSGGIMVNYIYRLDKIEENAQAYFSTGHIEVSPDV
ncbi:uncharacterized protein LOC108193164 [Daucus carota subsp. sativus]|uniref:uncharacterized protein LOC108193164 n=1 Tax=Daucus carota subsp. sativus TaxID=79200 RepID=UPI0007EF34D4|nr:PREDICTED: malonyl-CoA decarboxylase, mitochondrial [Daucus carota subsp. sativus]